MEDINIVYEDDLGLAIDKPAGLSVHGDGLKSEETVADWFASRCPAAKDVGEPGWGRGGVTVLRPGIVHRLDKATSGVMILAKNQKSYQHFKEQFLTRRVKKTYYLLVYGRVKNTAESAFQVIDQPIGRHPKDPRRRLAGEGARGTLRDAVTRYTVRDQFSGYSFIEARPQTGRMHQLRVHFKFIGYPIVNDTLYAPGRAKPSDLDRLGLHAGKIELTWPSKEVLSLEAGLAPDIAKALEKLKIT